MSTSPAHSAAHAEHSTSANVEFRSALDPDLSTGSSMTSGAFRDERKWLVQFLTIAIYADLFVVLVAAAIGLMTGAVVAWYATATMLVSSLVLTWARWNAQRGYVVLAGWVVFSAANLTGVVGIILLPVALPFIILAPLIGLLLCLPYVSPKHLRLLLPLTWLLSLLITYLSVGISDIPPAPWVSGMPFYIGVAYIIGLLLLLLSRYYNRLIYLLANTQQANETLRQVQSDLEATVARRTAELKERESRFRTISELTSDYAFSLQIDPQGIQQIEWVTEAFTRIIGYNKDEFDQRGGFRAISYPEDLPILERRNRRILTNVPDESEFRIINAWGDIRWLRAYTRPIWSDQERRVVAAIGAVRDITDRKRYEQQIEELIFTDSLTRLANRQLLQLRLAEALADAPQRGVAPAVLYLDLDRFKNVNDTLGPNVGDELLVQVAARLRSAIEPGDILARLGGDEFAVLLPDAGEVRAASLARRLLALLDTPLIVFNRPLHVRASIGVACYPRHGMDVVTLLKNADIAMYRAKKRGGHYEFHDPAQAAFPQERLDLEQDLRAAVDSASLFLAFQPILDLRDGSLKRVEALVRWEHPSRGAISPSIFISIAEESGIIRDLDRLVIQLGLRQAAVWSDQGYDLGVAINLSPQSLQDQDLVEYMNQIFAETAAHPEQVMLEVTESAAMRDPETTRRVLGRLKEMGMSVALDDFGSGYASLTYLKQLPVDLMKVDRAFVRGIGHGPKDEGVLRAFAGLAAGLGMPVVAEGVETEEQLHWLRDAGFDQIQGYLVGRPMPAEQIIALFKERIGKTPDHMPRVRPHDLHP